VSEETLRFGSDQRLVGTLTRPEGGMHDIGFLWFNAGVIPRIGPNRLYVRLCRMLAARGFPNLRFDVSGRGDSSAATAPGSFTRHSMLDLGTAIAALGHASGTRRYVLGGLCSGADTSFLAALEHEQVVGLVLLDPWAYPSRRTRWVQFLRRVREPGLALALARGCLRAMAAPLRRIRAWRAGPVDPILLRMTLDRREFAAGLDRLLARGVSLYLSYSGSLYDEYNYAGQFADVFGARARHRCLQVDFVPDANHTHTELAAQQDLMHRIADWSDRLAGLQAPASGSARLAID
jgi:hypothetical protein